LAIVYGSIMLYRKQALKVIFFVSPLNPILQKNPPTATPPPPPNPPQLLTTSNWLVISM